MIRLLIPSEFGDAFKENSINNLGGGLGLFKYTYKQEYQTIRHWNKYGFLRRETRFGNIFVPGTSSYAVSG